MSDSLVNSLGWEEDPPDGEILRSRTKLGQLRIWHFPRKGITQINGKDFAGPVHHPGLYILLHNQEKKVYVGESSDLRDRLDNHNRNPPKEIGNFDQIIAIGNGRDVNHSILTENSMRLYLEKAMIHILEDGGILTPINKMKEEPKMTAASETIGKRLQEELHFVLQKLGFAIKLIKSLVPIEVISDEALLTMLAAKGYRIEKTKRDQIILQDGTPIFVRPGTKPRKSEPGWHITLRSKPRELLNQEKGALAISRGYGYLIDAVTLKKWLGENLWPMKAGKEAIDVYADLDQEKLFYHTDYQPLDLKPFILTNLEKKIQ